MQKYFFSLQYLHLGSLTVCGPYSTLDSQYGLRKGREIPSLLIKIHIPGSQNFNDFKSLQSKRRSLCFTKGQSRKETPDLLKGLRAVTNSIEDILGPDIKYINYGYPLCEFCSISVLYLGSLVLTICGKQKCNNRDFLV